MTVVAWLKLWVAMRRLLMAKRRRGGAATRVRAALAASLGLTGLRRQRHGLEER